MEAIRHSCFHFPDQLGHYRGKVRDVYDLGERLVMVVSDRISAFDHILPRAIPYKGQVLNGISKKFLEDTASIVPNWFLESPHPNVSIGLKCEPIPIEMVVRAYLVGHAWRTYQSGQRKLCGVDLPEGMKRNEAFVRPIITPATKAAEGHDIDISREEILARDIVSRAIYEKMEEYALKLFAFGSEYAQSRGLILVDTKYEFGLYQGELMLIDEIHTPDSSRYFVANAYEACMDQGVEPEQLSKEFVREWLMDHGFMGKSGDKMPEMSNEMCSKVSDRYIELYEKLIGSPFKKTGYDRILYKIDRAVRNGLTKVG